MRASVLHEKHLGSLSVQGFVQGQYPGAFQTYSVLLYVLPEHRAVPREFCIKKKKLNLKVLDRPLSLSFSACSWLETE